MKKSAKKILCILLSLLLVAQVLIVLTACDNKLDPEKTPLVISTDALDGVFNPFSYTSGADGGVVGQTQIGMLSIDADGNVVAGWDQPSVAEGYSVITTGSKDDDDGSYSNYYTDYYFAIKDGIKFSDGTSLTIKDVLFNMYVYLDPVYTGSSTMYSIDIQGLSAYRTQSADDNAQSRLNQLVQTRAYNRRAQLVNWCRNGGNLSIEDYFAGYGKETLDEVIGDINEIVKLFKEELNTDWVASASMVEEYEKYYLQSSATDAITDPSAWEDYTKEGNKNKHITQQWEVFAIMYGMITTQSTNLGKNSKGDTVRKYTFEYNQSDTFDHSQQAMVDSAFSSFFPSDEPTKDNDPDFKDQLLQVITMYATSNSFLEYAMNSEREKELNKNPILEFDHISGIVVYEADRIPLADGAKLNQDYSGDVTFDSNRTILKIRINGVDPKALMSFSFTVAPMEYYSTASAIAKFVEKSDDEVEQSEREITVEGQTYNVKNYVGFGVEYSSTDFMDHINTNHVPRGAGPYRPSNGTAGGVKDDATIQKAQFFKNNIVNFERNNYFNTVMKDGHNANIKFLRFKVIASNAMTEAVTGKNPEVHISQPSASKKEIDKIKKLSGVWYKTVDYMGYGYIGINASYVKDIEVRRAIMMAMDTTLVGNYYQDNDLFSLIHRPMSTNSWAYPKGATSYYEYDDTGEIIKQNLQIAGYELVNGTLEKDGEKLKYTFTVAGETEDHPAYQTMDRAAKILNGIGFDITVTKDSQALSKLASGGLQVWAAAWSTSIDPDMYQVYHKDSTASSVKNWGYPYLLSAESTQEERDLLDALAVLIEEAREYTDQETRKGIYAEALDLVMELAIELPTYQRKEMYLINSKVVDEKTLCEATVYQSPLSEIWNVNFVGAK